MSDSTELINKINSLIKKHSDEIARFEAEKNTTQNLEKIRHLDDRIKLRKDHIDDLVNNLKKLETHLSTNANMLNPNPSTNPNPNPDTPGSEDYQDALQDDDVKFYDALEEDVNNIEREMEEKGNQQQEALKMREEEYKQKTGKDFNPLVTDELEQPKPKPPTPIQRPIPTPIQTPIQPPPKPPKPDNGRKTRKNRLTPQEIQMKQIGPNFVNEDITTPDQSQSKIYNGDNISIPEQGNNYVDLMDGINNPNPNPNPVNSGFRETIVSKGTRIEGPARPDTKLCPQILATGKKINTKYFIPSQLPNLTKLKTDITKEDIKKGGRKTRKRLMIRTRKNSRGKNSNRQKSSRQKSRGGKSRRK